MGYYTEVYNKNAKKKKDEEEEAASYKKTSSSSNSSEKATRKYVKVEGGYYSNHYLNNENASKFEPENIARDANDYVNNTNTIMDMAMKRVKEGASGTYQENARNNSIIENAAMRRMQELGNSVARRARVGIKDDSFNKNLSSMVESNNQKMNSLKESTNAVTDYYSNWPNKDAYDYQKKEEDKQREYDSMSSVQMKDRVKELKEQRKQYDWKNNTLYSSDGVMLVNNLSQNKDKYNEIDKEIKYLENASYYKGLQEDWDSLGPTNQDYMKHWLQGFRDVTSDYSDIARYFQHKSIPVDPERMVRYIENQELAEKAEQERKHYEEYANKWGGVPASIESVGYNFLKPLDLAEVIDSKLTGRPIRPDAMKYTNRQQTIRGEVGRNIESYFDGIDIPIIDKNLASFAYDTGMSIFDFVSALPLKETGALTLMSSNAAIDTMKRVAENGGSTDQAIMSGVASGITEAFFERFSIENLKVMAATKPKTVKAVLGNTAKQFVTEGSEEMFTDLVNFVSDDIINGDLSEYSLAVEQYLSKGYDEATAKKMATEDYAKNVATSFLAGGISGGFMSIGGNIAGYANGKTNTNINTKMDPIKKLAYEMAGANTNMNESLGNNSITQNDAIVGEQVQPVSDNNVSNIANNELTSANANKLPSNEINVLNNQNTQDYAYSNNVKHASALSNEGNVIVTGIDSVTDSDAVVNLSNGSTANLSEISFENPNVQLVYNNASTFDDTVVARAYLANYDDTVPGKMYDSLFKAVYNSGLKGASYDSLVNASGVFHEYLSGETLRSIHQLGVNRAAAYKEMKVEQNVGAVQREVTSNIASALGYKVNFADLGNANGMIKNGEVYIDVNSDNPSMVVLAHEITHDLKNTSKEHFDTFSNYVLDYLKNSKSEVYQQRFNNLSKLYSEQIEGLSEQESSDYINEEIVCNATEMFLTDADFVEQLTSENKNLAEKILESIKSFLDKLRELYKNYKASSKEGKAIAENIEVYETAKDLWSKAIENRVTNSESSSSEKFMFKGIKDGIEIYETSEDTKNMTLKERKKALVNMVRNEYVGRTAKFEKNGETYYAILDKDGIGKGVYGDKKSDYSGYKAKLSIGADGNYFELVENTKYKNSGDETGKITNSNIHYNVESWDYYVKTLECDNQKYDVLINVSNHGNKQYIYDVTLTTKKTNEKQDPQAAGIKPTSSLGDPVTDTIPQEETNVNTKSKNSKTLDAEPSVSEPTVVEQQDNESISSEQVSAESTVTDEKNSEIDKVQHYIDENSKLLSQAKEDYKAFYNSQEYDDMVAGLIDGSLDFDSELVQDMDKKEIDLKERATTYKQNIEKYQNMLKELQSRNDSEVDLDSNAQDISDVDQLKHSLKDTSNFDDFLFSDEFMESASYKEVSSIIEEGFKVLHSANVDKASVRKIAAKLRNEYASTYDINTLSDNLEKVFAYMQSAESVQYSDMVKIMTEVTLPVVDLSQKVDPEMQAMHKEFRDYVRGMKIRLNDSQKAEIEYMYGNYNDFRKSVFGSIILSDQGIYLDNIWGEIVDKSYGYLDLDTNENEQIIALADAINGMKPVVQNLYGMDNEAAAYDMALKVYEEYFKYQSDKEVSKQLLATREKLKKQIKEVREKTRLNYEERLKELRIKNRDIRSQKNDRITELKATHRENMISQRRKMREQNSNKKYVNRITKNCKDMFTWLENPNDKKHIPEIMRRTVANFLKTIDFVSHRAKPDSAQSMKWREKMTNLYMLLEKMDTNAETDTLNDYILEIDPDYLARLDKFIGGYENVTKLSMLDYNGLKELDFLVGVLKRSITDANKLYSNKRAHDIADLGDKTLSEFTTKNTDKDRSAISRWFHDTLNFSMVDARSYFNQLGDGAYSIYEEIREGFNNRVWKLKEAQSYMENVLKGIEVKEWTGKKAIVHEIKLGNGDTVNMTDAQIMSFYALWKRQQSQAHMLRGGIRVTDIKGKRQERVFHVSESDVKNIISMLSDEQIRVANDMQKFLSTTCSEWGNEVSMLMYGYKKFTEDSYFPLNVDDNQTRTKDGDNDIASFHAIKNMGFTKSTVKGAKNTINIGDIFDVFTKHVSDMAKYNAFCAPLSDAMRWYNYKIKNTDEDSGYIHVKSVKAEIQRVFGKEAKKYFENFIKSVNGTDAKVDKSVLDKLMSNYKAAAVGASLSVAIQQPTSIARAAAIINPKYLTKAVFTKNGAKKAIEHSAIAQWKSWGYYETMLGRSMREIITGQTTVVNDIKEKSMILAAKADDITWGVIWNACELEMKDLHPEVDVDSDTFNEMVTKRFDDIIDRTQVVDTVIHRAQIQKSNNALVQMSVSFMSEPFKSYNMVRTSVDEYRSKKISKSSLVRTINAWGVSVLLAAAAKAIVESIRDDDEYEKFSNKWLGYFGENSLDGLNPLTYIPFVKDVWSVLNGYDSTRMDMAGITSTIRAIENVQKFVTGSSTKNIWNISESIATAFSQLTGIPLKNAMREFEGIYNSFSNTNLGGNGASNKDIVERLYQSILDGDSKSYDELYNGLIKSGKSRTDIVSSLAGVLAESDSRVMEAAKLRSTGDLTGYVDIAEEIVKDGFHQDIVVRAVKRCQNKLEKENTKKESSYNEESSKNINDVIKEESMYLYSDIISAIDSNHISEAQIAINDIYNVKIKNGDDPKKARSSIKAQITKVYKPKYQSADLSNKEKFEIMGYLKSLRVNGAILYSQTDFINWYNNK